MPDGELNIILAQFTGIGFILGIGAARLWENRRGLVNELTYLEARKAKVFQILCEEMNGKIHIEDLRDLNMNMDCKVCGLQETCNRCDGIEEVNLLYR